MIRRPPRSTPLSLHDALPICPGRSELRVWGLRARSRIALREAYSELVVRAANSAPLSRAMTDRKSTRLNSSHGYISYAVFCLKKRIQTLDANPALRLITATHS